MRLSVCSCRCIQPTSPGGNPDARQMQIFQADFPGLFDRNSPSRAGNQVDPVRLTAGKVCIPTLFSLAVLPRTLKTVTFIHFTEWNSMEGRRMKTARRVRTRKVQCPFCPKTFTRTEHLQRHLGSRMSGSLNIKQPLTSLQTEWEKLLNVLSVERSSCASESLILRIPQLVPY